MNTLLPKYLTIVITMLLLTACSSIRDVSNTGYAYDNEHSIAWNISNASGMDSFSDAKVSPFQKRLYSRTDYDFSFPRLKNNKLNEASLPLTPLLQYRPTGMGPEDWQSNGILAWIPTELARTPEQASQLLSDKIEDAILTTFKESKQAYGELRKGNGYNDWLGKYVFQVNSSRYLAVQFADEYAGCELSKDKYFDPAHQNRPDCTFYTSFHSPEKIVQTPDFININATGKSFLIRHDGLNASYLDATYENITIHSQAETVRLKYAFLQKLSRHLPSWVIIFIEPHEDSGMPAVILQEGKVHFFFRAT